MILKMFTDEGLVGYGEPMNYEHWRVVAQAVDDMAEYLVGKDPLNIEDPRCKKADIRSPIR